MQQKYIAACIIMVSELHPQSDMSSELHHKQGQKGTVEKGTAEKILKWSQNQPLRV